MHVISRGPLTLSAVLVGALLFSHPAAAEDKKIAYAVVELDVRQPEEFTKDFLPLVGKVYAEAGAVFLAKPTAPVAIDDVAPKRVAILRFDSLEKANATFSSQAYRDARKIGEKYASFKIFVVEAPAN